MRRFPVALALLCAGSAPAGELVVTGERCDSSIHVVAVDVRLSETLREIADALGFTLTFSATRDPLVEMNRTADPDTVLRELTAGDNLLAVNRFDPDCGRNVIAEVSILGVGDESERLVHVPEKRQSLPAGTLSETPVERPRPTAGMARNIPRHIWQKHGREIRNGSAIYDEKTGAVIVVEGKDK